VPGATTTAPDPARSLDGVGDGPLDHSGASGPLGLPDPPADPDDWTDEQWLEWLEAADAAAGDGGALPERPVTRAGRMAASVPGTVLGNAMIGVANAIYGRQQAKVVIVQEAGGDPPTGDDIELHLDPDHPDRSQVVVRRHRPRS